MAFVFLRNGLFIIIIIIITGQAQTVVVIIEAEMWMWNALNRFPWFGRKRLQWKFFYVLGHFHFICENESGQLTRHPSTLRMRRHHIACNNFKLANEYEFCRRHCLPLHKGKCCLRQTRGRWYPNAFRCRKQIADHVEQIRNKLSVYCFSEKFRVNGCLAFLSHLSRPLFSPPRLISFVENAVNYLWLKIWKAIFGLCRIAIGAPLSGHIKCWILINSIMKLNLTFPGVANLVRINDERPPYYAKPFWRDDLIIIIIIGSAHSSVGAEAISRQRFAAVTWILNA